VTASLALAVSAQQRALSMLIRAQSCSLHACDIVAVYLRVCATQNAVILCRRLGAILTWPPLLGTHNSQTDLASVPIAQRRA